MRCTVPKSTALSTGELIGIAAPATLLEKELLHAGAEKLARWGHPVFCDPRLLDRHRSFAGIDAVRADVLMRLVKNPEVRAIWCARGGYGVTRILSLLDKAGLPKYLRRDPKPILGYSDITALHLYAYGQARVKTIHSPLIATNSWLKLKSSSEKILRALLEGKIELGKKSYTTRWPTRLLHPLRQQSVDGVILGGNLTLIVNLLGTKWQPSFRGAFLFFEDCGEAPYRLDRMITQLWNSGALEGVRGVLVGDVTHDVVLKPGEKKTAWKVVLEDRFAAAGIPVLYNLPVGHGKRNEALPLGVRARITRAGKLEILEQVVG